MILAATQPHISDGVLIAGFAALASVISAALGALALVMSSRASGHAKQAAVAVTRTATATAATARDAAVIREQVENNHSTNLREEGDDRHDEVISGIREIRADIGGMRSDIRQLYRQDDNLREHLAEIENTIPKGSPLWPTTSKPPATTPKSAASAPSPKGSPSTSSSPWAPGPPPPSRP